MVKLDLEFLERWVDSLFIFSDERGLLYPYTPDPSNPGDTRMLRKEEVERMGGLKIERGVPAVLLQDILSSIPSNTVILKLDVQGYECKVRKQFKNTLLVF